MYRDKDYINIFHLACNRELEGYKKYQELVPYEDILHDLFYNVQIIKDLNKFIEETINIVQRIPDSLNNLDPALLSSIAYHNNPFNRITDLELIFFPKEVLDDDVVSSPGYYLSTFNNVLTHHIYRESSYIFNYKKFSDLYIKFREIYHKNHFYQKDFSIIITILAYIYVNDLDFKMVDEYISNVEYYNDVIEMSGIVLNENNIGNYFSVMYRLLFKNVEGLFNKNKKLIK